MKQGMKTEIKIRQGTNTYSLFLYIYALICDHWWTKMKKWKNFKWNAEEWWESFWLWGSLCEWEWKILGNFVSLKCFFFMWVSLLWDLTACEFSVSFVKRKKWFLVRFWKYYSNFVRLAEFLLSSGTSVLFG